MRALYTITYSEKILSLTQDLAENYLYFIANQDISDSRDLPEIKYSLENLTPDAIFTWRKYYLEGNYYSSETRLNYVYSELYDIKIQEFDGSFESTWISSKTTFRRYIGENQDGTSMYADIQYTYLSSYNGTVYLEIFSSKDDLINFNTANITKYFTYENGTPIDDRAEDIDAGGGNDTVILPTSKDHFDALDLDAAIVLGGAGNDTIDGEASPGSDETVTRHLRIIGGEGSDTVIAGKADAVIIGGVDPWGNEAKDQYFTVYSFYYNNYYWSLDFGSRDFKDVLRYLKEQPVSTSTVDQLTGGAGNDAIVGGGGFDIIDGGNGDDLLFGGAGNDAINGGNDNGADVIYDGDGADVVNAGGGDDRIISLADKAHDVLNGGKGDDRIISEYRTETTVKGVGKTGNLLVGGEGRDTYEATAGDKIDDLETGETVTLTLAGKNRKLIAWADSNGTHFNFFEKIDGSAQNLLNIGNRLDLSKINVSTSASRDEDGNDTTVVTITNTGVTPIKSSGIYEDAFGELVKTYSKLAYKALSGEMLDKAFAEGLPAVLTKIGGAAVPHTHIIEAAKFLTSLVQEQAITFATSGQSIDGYAVAGGLLQIIASKSPYGKAIILLSEPVLDAVFTYVEARTKQHDWEILQDAPDTKVFDIDLQDGSKHLWREGDSDISNTTGSSSLIEIVSTSSDVTKLGKNIDNIELLRGDNPSMTRLRVVNGNELGNVITSRGVLADIHAGAGNDLVYGSYMGGKIDGGTGNDTLWGSNGGSDTFVGGQGNDIIGGVYGLPDVVDYSKDGGSRGITVRSDSTVIDSWGNTDTLYGIEVIVGTEKADTFGDTYLSDGTIMGGGGDDTFTNISFTPVVVGGKGSDTITRYFNPSFSQHFDLVVSYEDFDKKGVSIRLDAMGAFTVIDPSGGQDVVKGATGVRGTQAADKISGNAFNNLIAGLGGSDSLDGGGGLDTLSYENEKIGSSKKGATVRLDLGSAVDPGGNADEISNFENVEGSDGNDTIIGDAGSNSLFGMNGDDVLDGGNGNDYLEARSGVDVVIVGAGSDKMSVAWLNRQDSLTDIALLSFEKFSKGVTFTLGTGGTGTFTDPTGDKDTYERFGGVRGSAANDKISGNDNLNVLIGLGGTDTFNGGGGLDYVQYQFDSQFGGKKGITLDLMGGYAVDGFGKRDTLSNIEGAQGTAYDDKMTGDGAVNYLYGFGGNDTLVGKGGGDRLFGGSGADVLDGGEGYDVAVYYGGTKGVIADLASGKKNTNDAKGDTYKSIEGLNGTEFDDNLFGDSGSNRLIGAYGNDRLDGRGGDDQLYGGDYSDDLLIGGTGRDELDGNLGIDTASYSTAKKGVIASLANNTRNTGDAAGDTYYSVENLTGSSYADQLTGDLSRNTLVGGAGNDKFVFNTMPGSGNMDTIGDFSVKDDTIWLDRDVFTKVGAVGDLSTGAFYVGAKAHDGSDRIIYNRDTGQLFYDADGSGSSAAVQFALVDKRLSITAADIDIIA